MTIVFWPFRRVYLLIVTGLNTSNIFFSNVFNFYGFLYLKPAEQFSSVVSIIESSTGSSTARVRLIIRIWIAFYFPFSPLPCVISRTPVSNVFLSVFSTISNCITGRFQNLNAFCRNIAIAVIY